MDEQLTLSRPRLTTFLACRRRFELRYLRQLAWPASPPDEPTVAALARGQQFHQRLQRHFLGLPVPDDAIADPVLRQWWQQFEQAQLPLPPGKLLTELSLTIPIGRHFLTGRFDLLVMGETAAGAPAAHLFDWKTSRPQTETALRQDWQTRLYLALLVEGGAALLGDGRSFAPEHCHLSYWYVSEPDIPRTVHYSQAAHGQNWADLQRLVAEIDAALAAESWPLTDDWSHCRACAYQAYCGRQAAGTATFTVTEDDDSQTPVTTAQFEPHTP